MVRKLISRLGVLIDEYYSRKLSNQLVITFLGMFALIIAICSVSIYVGIFNILKKNTENNIIQQFRQYEYNINSFCEGVDLISRQLITDANLQNITGYSSLSADEQIILRANVLRKFSDTLSNYSHIDSIIFYSGDGLILRANSVKSEVEYSEESKKNWFYNSELFKKAKADRMKLVWAGGYTDREFNVAKDEMTNQAEQLPKYYISAVRTVFYGNLTGTLIINIKMHEFTSVYNNWNINQVDEMYIMNDNGKIISHVNEEKIGSLSNAYKDLPRPHTNLSFSVIDRSQNKQIIYYSLSIGNWILVDEIPTSYITKDISKLKTIVIFMFLVSILLAAVLSKYNINKIFSPLTQLTNLIKKMGDGKLGLTLDIDSKNEIGVLVKQFNTMSTNIQELIEMNAAVQEEKRKIEMEALRSQINPHFIYNTLNVIKWMALISKADNIVDCIVTFSDFLKPVFQKNNIMCSIQEEVDYTKNYIKLMNYRFAGRFNTEFVIPEDLLDCKILRFVLQPIVENAITHGLMNQNSGEISISMREDQQILYISVTDNGAGMTAERLKEISALLASNNQSNTPEGSGSGVGLLNVNRRIKLHFGEAYGLEIHSQQGQGTSVVLKIPAIREQ